MMALYGLCRLARHLFTAFLRDGERLILDEGAELFLRLLFVKTKTPASSGGSGKLKAISPKGTTLC